MAVKKKRATLTELENFANQVRRAGGGNPIDALLPSVPEDINQCLIARNLNFNCSVGGSTPCPDKYNGGRDWPNEAWFMQVDSERLARDIARGTGMRRFESNGEHFLRLPAKFGQLAQDFDRVEGIAHSLEKDAEGSTMKQAWRRLPRASKKLFRDLWPYVERSRQEAYSLATIVNDDGSIVI